MKINVNELCCPPDEDFSELTLGNRLRAIRVARGLKQKELARMVGLMPNYISCYERGINLPNITTLEWICKALGVSASDILGF